MKGIRQLIIAAIVVSLAASPIFAQERKLRIRYLEPSQPSAAAASLHPAAKGALVGAAAGAGFWGAVGVWYCTAGPNESGECSNAGMWTRGFLMWSAIGAGVGALIGALK